MRTAAENSRAAARVVVMAVAVAAQDVASSFDARWVAVRTHRQTPASGRQARSLAEEVADLVDRKELVDRAVEGQMRVQADQAPEMMS